MGKIAFVFAGQGAQYSGMGADIAEVSAAAHGAEDADHEICRVWEAIIK